ncbi:chemotaxis protein CheW [Teredinibacter sp. KSP-S5-2]|uniref:chemotaxis protein CheW n=1 Tax=Teredinibacter sp. KSP-S5-2 TaxID=3034506 RepID=UPI00293483DC|nr:chemotaxis protein CheW [Teredinibacter sp. KSP-S5-2]WNO07885.1 chemotaxis protein CheW [Teredinibacter sp. KSP-S5-2]
MSGDSAKTALEDYFADLLREDDPAAQSQELSPKPSLAEHTPPAEISSQQVVPSAKLAPKVSPKPQAEVEIKPVQEKLEREKREQLQALLNTRPLQIKPRVETKIKTEVVVEPVVEKITETVLDDLHHVNQMLEWGENGRPMWAQGRFDALLFQVSGLTLAVPLIALGQIQPLTDELTPIFGQSDWFMGILPTPIGQIKTVNTALFVMPEKYNDSFLKTAKYVMTIDGLPWGLAVDSVNQPITLNTEDVNWRTQRTKRPWLAGTVKSAMCALIDIPQMGKLLSDSEKSRKPH